MTQPFAPCYCCGASEASPWRRALVLPALLHHVRCADCGRTFDARTGQPNGAALLVHGLWLAAALAAGLALAAWYLAPL